VVNIQGKLDVALQHCRNNQRSQAEVLYRQAKADHQQDPQTLFHLGRLAYELGQFADAETFFHAVLAAQPEHLNTLILLGSLYCQQSRWEETLGIAQQSLKLNPEPASMALIYYHMGLANTYLKKLKPAIAAYRQSIHFGSTNPLVFNQLGLALNQQKQLGEAIKAYQTALELAPELVEAHINLGNVYKQQGKFDEAVEVYQTALQLDPDSVSAYLNLGNTLKRQGKPEEAICAYQRALSINPDLDEARFAICVSQLSILYVDEAAVQHSREQYQQQLCQLADYYAQATPAVRARAAELVGWTQPFYLAYQGLNDRALQKTYGEMICRLMASRYPQWSQPIALPKPAPHEKLRVGFVSGFFRTHSVWKIPLKGWIENLDKSEFELLGYYTVPSQDTETHQASKAFDKFIQGPLSIDQWAETIRRDNLHVLIFVEFGMDPVTVQLGCLRLAPLQMTTWGHPNTSGLPTIDYYLSSDLMESPQAQEYYTEQLVRLPNLSIHYTPLAIQPAAITRAELGIETDEIMFWCCQSLYKYLPQHDDVFPRIAQGLQQARFVFIENSSRHITDIFCQRLERAFSAGGLRYQDYCRFIPRLAPEKFVAVASIADVFLDSIGWSGCNSTLESLACHLPIVTLPSATLRGRHSLAILKMMGLEETIAASKDEYVKLAVRVGQDATYRQNLSQKIAENKHKLYADMAPVRALEDFILELYHKPRQVADQSLSEALKRATQFLRTQRLTDAEPIYRQILSQQPDHAEALYGLAMVLQQRGHLSKALNALTQAAQAHPDSAKVWFGLGHLHQVQGQLPEAIAAYRQTTELRPDSAPIYNNLGYALQCQGQWPEAIACYQKALDLQPGCTEAEVNLGNALFSQGQLAASEYPHYATLNYQLGVNRLKVGDLQTAIAYLQQAVALQPDLTAAHHHLSVALQAFPADSPEVS
jgi:predicted O-linked N-acetylglucosamine transferase (SPINDLY family)